MKKISFITPDYEEYGFKLSGVSHYVVREKEVEDTLRRIISEPDTGLVIIDERSLKGIDEKKLREIEKVWQGILLVLPSPEQRGIEIEDYASRLIRRAIGYHVRLRL